MTPNHILTINDVKTAYLGATPPEGWWTKLICRILGAKTFHWFIFVVQDDKGWIISESVGKGTSLDYLIDDKVYVYRIREVRQVNPMRLISIHAEYGQLPYDWQVILLTGLWWLCKHLLGKIIPVIHDKAVNCQEWVCLVAHELGVHIIPDDQYPDCVNLEHSPHLEYIGILKT